MPLPKFSALSESFDTPLDPAVWSGPATTGTVVVGGGHHRIGGTGGAFGSLNRTTIAHYDLTESHVIMKVVPSAPGKRATFIMEVIKSDNSQRARWIIGDGETLTAYVDNAVTVVSTDFTYDPVAHLWLRLSEHAGTVTWSTAPNATGPWASQYTATDLNLSDAVFSIFAKVYSGSSD